MTQDSREKRVEIAVGAIILEKDLVLLVKRQKHFTDNWTLPVGVLEFGETAENCIKREVKEELGLDFTSPTFCCFNDGINVLPNRHFIVLYFYGNAEGDVVLQEDELTDYCWIPIKEALTLELGFEQSEALQKFHNSYYSKSRSD